MTHISYYSFTIVKVHNTLSGEGRAARMKNDYREGPSAALLLVFYTKCQHILSYSIDPITWGWKVFKN